MIEKVWETNNRIPNTISAKHYNLWLKPDLKSKTFTGNVNIEIDSSEQRDFFLVHSKFLKINKDKLLLTCLDNSKKVFIVDAFEYPKNEFFVIKTESVFPGKYELYMEFEGLLSGKIVGFYYSEYSTDDRGIIPLSTTKFEPTFARQAFPCFDEPSFRSSYNLTIVRPSDESYSGLANMPVKKEIPNSPSEGLTEVVFEKSVSMPTYLACFIVSDFQYIEENLDAKNGLLPFRIYSPKEKLEDLKYALKFGSKTLLHYEQVYDIGFPLPKCDMAAIPDYSSGATEHWGIITYRESNLLYNNLSSSTQNLQRVASVIAHELAHQWFGNLVTMEWWNDLWLNEGFARYIEFKGVHKQHPDWEMTSQFVTNVVHLVFDFDAKLSSHPIVKTVQTPEEINAMFDTISYEKGSSVLRMLEGFMGEESFRNGVNSFLKKFSFKNAVTQNLYDHLTEAWNRKSMISNDKETNISETKNDIGVIMKTWTEQMGYPVITVKKISPTQLSLTQKRFLKDSKAKYNESDSPYKYKWDVPISIITPDKKVQNHWLYREEEKLIIEINPNHKWFKLNYKQRGYYRVNYPIDMWKILQKICADDILTAEDRAELYDDAIAFADAGILSYDTALDMTQSLNSESHYVPWNSGARRLAQIMKKLRSFPVIEPFKAYVRNLTSKMYNELQWKDEGSHIQRLLRSVIVDLSGMSGCEACLHEAGVLLQSWIDDASFDLPLDTKRMVYWWGMIKSGTKKNWDIMWQRCLNELDAAQKSNLYFGLSNVQNEDILRRYIDLSFDVKNTKTQDFLLILQYIASNPTGTDLTWDWVRTNWKSLEKRYGTDDRYLGRIVPSISKYFATRDKLEQVESFFEKQGQSGIVAQYRQETIETIKSNIDWLKSYSDVIENWLINRDRKFA